MTSPAALLLLLTAVAADPTWDRLWAASHPPSLTPWFTYDILDWDTAVADTLRPIVVDSGVFVDGPWNNRTLVRVRGSRVTGPSALAQYTVVSTQGGNGQITVRSQAGRQRTFQRLDGKPFDTAVHSLVTYANGWALQQSDGWVPIVAAEEPALGLNDFFGSAPILWLSADHQRISIKNPVDQSKPTTFELLPVRRGQQPANFAGLHVGGQVQLSISGGHYYFMLLWGPGPEDWDNYEGRIVTPTQLGETSVGLGDTGVVTATAPPPITWLTQVSDDGKTVATASGLTLTRQDNAAFDTPHHARFFQLRDQDSPLQPELQTILDKCLRNTDNDCLDIAEKWQSGQAVDVVRMVSGRGQKGQWMVLPPSKRLVYLADNDAKWREYVDGMAAAWKAQCEDDPHALDTAPVTCSQLAAAEDKAKALGLSLPSGDAGVDPSAFQPPLQPWAIGVILLAAVLVAGAITGVGVAKS